MGSNPAVFAVEIGPSLTPAQRDAVERLERQIFESLYEFSDYYRCRTFDLEAAKFKIFRATFKGVEEGKPFLTRFSSVQDKQGRTRFIAVEPDEQAIGSKSFDHLLQLYTELGRHLKGLKVRLLDSPGQPADVKTPFST